MYVVCKSLLIYSNTIIGSVTLHCLDDFLCYVILRHVVSDVLIVVSLTVCVCLYCSACTSDTSQLVSILCTCLLARSVHWFVFLLICCTSYCTTSPQHIEPMEFEHYC